MGLDWVVIAKQDGAREVNPTEAIGARRVDPADEEVMAILHDVWSEGDRAQPFADFVRGLAAQEVPPIVIPFGLGFEAALPAVRAEVQYYGYRGQALLPDGNRVLRQRQDAGWSSDTLYADMPDAAAIEARRLALAQALSAYAEANVSICALARRYYASFRAQDQAAGAAIEDEFTDQDMADHVFEIFAVLGAIDWLAFWSDKGFRIAADH